MRDARDKVGVGNAGHLPLSQPSPLHPAYLSLSFMGVKEAKVGARGEGVQFHLMFKDLSGEKWMQNSQMSLTECLVGLFLFTSLSSECLIIKRLRSY